MKKAFLLLSIIAATPAYAQTVTLIDAINGSLTTPAKPKDEDKLDLTFSVPFARVTDPFKRIAHREFLSLLQKERQETREDKTIRIFKIDLPLFATADEQYEYNVAQLETEVVAGEKKNSAQYTERDFETHRLVTRSSSRIFGRDLSLRYTATYGGSGAFGLCLNLPGENLAADEQKLLTTITQLTPPNVTLPSETDTSMVTAKFDFSRTCVALPIGQPDSGKDLDLQATMAAPEANGPAIQTQVPEQQLRDFYAGEFVKKESGDQLSEDEREKEKKAFLDGSWLLKKRNSHLTHEAQYLRSSLSTVFHRIAVPETSKQLATALKDTCRRLQFAEDPSYEKLDSFCREDLDRIQIKSLAVPEKYSRAAKCYEGFARLTEYQPSLATCQIEVHLQIELPDKDDREPIKQLLREFVAQSVIPQSWKKGLEENHVDPFELALLLDLWEKEGHLRVDELNWRDDFPALLNEIRNH